MIVKLLSEHHLEFLSLKGDCRGSSESTQVKMPHCWKSHALAQILFNQQLLPLFPNQYLWTRYYNSFKKIIITVDKTTFFVYRFNVQIRDFWCCLIIYLYLKRTALLNRKFHIWQISHCVKNWYQNVTFVKCEICVWSISII